MTESAAGTACSARTEHTQSDPEEHQRQRRPYMLDPASLPDHIDVLYRAAWALCGNQHDAEDLVQTTFAQVLKRPRIIRNDNVRGYLLRALRNAYSSHYRALARRPATAPLDDDAAPSAAEPEIISSRELMATIATAPPHYRDAVIAIDLLGLSYREAATALRTAEGTVTSRLHRGRQHIARELTDRGV